MTSKHTYHIFVVDPETGNIKKDYWKCSVCKKIKEEKYVVLKYKYDVMLDSTRVDGAICLNCYAKIPKLIFNSPETELASAEPTTN